MTANGGITKLPGLGQAGRGDWRGRILDRLHERGFDSVTAFADASPLTSLQALADELSTDHNARVHRADVAVEYLTRVWRDEADRAGTDAIEYMARRMLAGQLHQDVPGGWLADWNVDSDACSRMASVFAGWSSYVGTLGDEERHTAVHRVMNAMIEAGRDGQLPSGWLPASADDPLLVEIFARHWREPT
jgi:hypothetical protein